jgi:ABC-2 type transport system permease protein
MNPTTVAIRAGLQRGWIEFRWTMTNAGELLGWLWPSIIALAVLYFLSGRAVPGTDFSVGTYAIPGLLGVNVVFSGMLGLTVALIMDREDGTLLRMKAVPNGMLGYLVGKVASNTGMTVAILFILLVPAAFLFDGLKLGSPSAWLTLAWVLVLGLIATLPIGAVIGSLFNSVQNLGFVAMLIMVLAGISGVFYPITTFPAWLQWIGQAFPIYWLGLGMRSALLPDAMSSAEIGDSWRHLETVGVLGLWAIIGFVIAPVVLRRMARRQSGSGIDARQEKPVQRGTR